MRSMFSAVSALSAHQMKMDVIGNNIANVNTVAFKGSRVTFKETFNQTLKGAGAGSGGRGGTNPMQVGLGVDVGAVDVLHKVGTPERTDNPTDLMIDGDGFFMVSDDVNSINKYYTRAGNFVLDDDGYLVTQDGLKVLGYMADETGRLKTSLEGLRIDNSAVYPPQATKPSVPPIPGEDIVTFTGNLYSGTELMDKIDTATPATNPPTTPLKPIAGKGTTGGIYQFDENQSKAAGKPIYVKENDDFNKAVGKETTVQVFDDFGNIHTIKMIFTKKTVDTGTGTSTWQVDAFYLDKSDAMLANGETIGWTKDADGKITPATSANGFKYGNGSPAGSFTLEFDKDGKVKTTDPKMPFTIGSDLTDGADALSFEMDFSKLTQFSDQSATHVKVKGYKQGTLDKFSIATNGEITGTFSNGETRLLGNVAIANFENSAGLEKTQSNMYIETRNSGIPTIGFPSASGFSQLKPGNLEMANVDLGREFTQMITTQRGFQANSKVITTTDEMLQELVNLKR